MSELLHLLRKLHHRGIHALHVTFSGYGDNGDINDITCFGGPQNAQVEVPFPKPDLMQPENNIEQDHLHNVISVFIEDNVTCDWYNNEGGGGDVRFNLHDMSYRITSYYNEVVQQECDDDEGTLLEESEDAVTTTQPA
jgi:hypothetical protein